MRRALMVIALAVCGETAPATGSLAAATCDLEPGGTYTVMGLADAETLLLDDGSQVRLIGALVSRSSKEELAGRQDPALTAVKRLVEGRFVELGYGGRREDRYRRRLAQVFALQGTAKVWVQGHLVEEGHARAYALPGNDACLAELLAKEQSARDRGIGLWSLAANRVRSAERVSELAALMGEFAIVEGEIRHVAERSSRTYLNFGDDWRRDFTVSVASSLSRKRKEAGAFFKSLQGQRVRVRGWIERRNGPMIELSSFAEIEVLDAVRGMQNEAE